MASPTLITPTTKPKTLVITSFKSTCSSTNTTTNAATTIPQLARRQFMALTAGIFTPTLLVPVYSALATSDEEYIKETEEVIGKIRSTINMDKKDPNVAEAVAELRETSNSWVAKYRREKSLLGRASFRDMYSALNAVSGHYISFGPTAPIPVKRKQRILEEMDTAEKALLRGR
ncbi:photosystem II repair protein PSB27-H1 protein [Thalictrum thalictroides]|uniref:Photosystem II repair protein PSB27-H1 protein n=1 Tax=Thalictrum thalictroides TaxID=46969 RepID=A0A7J6VQ27_THATH|nr:photosystem II repair protein PSB27-H1 protein [Thalictrum thalictroides]